MMIKQLVCWSVACICWLTADGVTGYNVDTCAPGRTVIVHLFSWKWTDIARECEDFLGPKQFCGVQISPPNEHRVVSDPQRPWWERYQPISYELCSRSGTEAEFIDMVQRCNDVNVRIFVDAVINHMCGYSPGAGAETGSCGSSYNSGQMQFPVVPYVQDDFKCCSCSDCNTGSCNIESYQDVQQIRNCRLVSLLDLDLSKPCVLCKIATFLNRLIEIGVAGFRIDAAKHMWPAELQLILNGVKNLNTDAGFPANTRPFVYNEVIDLGGEPISGSEYTHLGRVTEFRYSRDLGKAFRRKFDLSVLSGFASSSWNWIPSDRAFVFVDNHDNQRGHGAGGEDILTFYNGCPYRLATVFGLAHSYGFSRIMSSYRWPGGPTSNDWYGPPHNTDLSVKDVQVSTTTQQCLGDWVCEHRWPIITAMVGFRNTAGSSPMSEWWDDGHRQIAFARTGKGFVAINDDASKPMNVHRQTTLPAGVYCDVITGVVTSDCKRCTGRSIAVGQDGKATIYIDAPTEGHCDTAIAIHIGAQLTASTPLQRTIIFMKFQSQAGQHVFIRGGIGYGQRSECHSSPDSCKIPIQHRLHDVPDNTHYSEYRSWADGDTKLDWGGAENGQGKFNNNPAAGTPAAWTTNDQSNAQAYHPLNKYGDHYWLVTVDMDCSATEDGWFELKAYITVDNDNDLGWESDITQVSQCNSDIGASRPYSSTNHMARCGHTNVFEHKNGCCTITA